MLELDLFPLIFEKMHIFLMFFGRIKVHVKVGINMDYEIKSMFEMHCLYLREVLRENS